MSGQIPLDPATGTMVDGDIAAQTHRVFRNLAGILEAAGSSFDRVVRTTVYLADMNDFAAMNEVYATLLQLAGAGALDDPGRAPAQDARVEIDVIAAVGSRLGEIPSSIPSQAQPKSWTAWCLAWSWMR